MKKFLLFALVLSLVLGLVVGGYVFAAGGRQSATETAIAVIGENVEMAVQSPLQVVTKKVSSGIGWEKGEATTVYPGEVLGNGEISITNVSPTEQGVALFARPIQGEAEFEVVAKSNGLITGQIVLEPAATINLKIEIKVAYGSSISSPFKGVELIVRAVPPPSPPPVG